MNKRDNIIKWSIISIFVGLYAMVSIISTIHVIDFFRLSNPNWLAVTLAIAFEVGAAASLAAIIILDRTSRWLVWSLFIIITLMQMMGNMYYAYTHLGDYQYWSELFWLNEEEPIFQKRILAVVSGAILPIVALGFIKSLVDYIRPSKTEELTIKTEKKVQIKSTPIREVIEEDILEEEPTKEDSFVEEPVKEEIIQETLNVEEPKEPSVERGILDNFNMADQMIAKIKRTENEDKYPKESQQPSGDSSPRVYGGM